MVHRLGGAENGSLQWGPENTRLDKPLACQEAGVPGLISDRRFGEEGNS